MKISCFACASFIFLASAFSALAAVKSSSEYVQDGLVAHWDGIDNTLNADGTRSHTDEAETWYDLSGNGLHVNLKGRSYIVVEKNAILSKKNANKVAGLPSAGAGENEALTYVEWPMGDWATNLTVKLDASPTGVEQYTVEIVMAAATSLSGISNASSAQTMFASPRGSFGYRRTGTWYLLYPRKTTSGDISLHTGFPSAAQSTPMERHTVSCVFGTHATGSTELWTDGYDKYTSSFGNGWATTWYTYYCLFNNTLCDIRIYAVRVYNRKLTDAERQQNYQLDEDRFSKQIIDVALPSGYQQLEYLVATGGHAVATSVHKDSLKSLDLTATWFGTEKSGYGTNATDNITILREDETDYFAQLYEVATEETDQVQNLLVPCYREADGVAGLFDVNANLFREPAGNSFSHGTGGAYGIPWFGSSAKDTGLTSETKMPSAAKSALSFSVWVRNPKPIHNFYGAYRGAILSSGALCKTPGFICYVDGSKAYQTDNLFVQLRYDEDNTTLLSLPEGRATEISTDNKWHHLGFSFSSTGGEDSLGIANLYLDGELVASTNRAVVPLFSASFTVANRYEGDTFNIPYNGELSQVTVWTNALTASQIKKLMVKPVTGSQPGLWGAWSLNNGSDGLKDLVSNKHLKIITGSGFKMGFLANDIPWQTKGFRIIVR